MSEILGKMNASGRIRTYILPNRLPDPVATPVRHGGISCLLNLQPNKPEVGCLISPVQVYFSSKYTFWRT